MKDIDERLLNAVKKGYTSGVQEALNEGADPRVGCSNNKIMNPDSCSLQSRTLYYAIKFGYVDVVKILLDVCYSNSHVPDDLRDLASATGNVDIIQLLEDHEEKLIKKQIEEKSPDEKLLDAVWRNNLEGVLAALRGGANPNIENKHVVFLKLCPYVEVAEVGWAPLHGAAYYGNVKMVKILLEAGANQETTDSSSQTPLDLAIEKRHFYVEALLKKEIWKREMKDTDKQLFKAVKAGDVERVRILLGEGADPVEVIRATGAKEDKEDNEYE